MTLQEEFDLAYAELQSQRETENTTRIDLKRIEAELWKLEREYNKSTETKLKKLEREYSKSERERELYKQRYSSVAKKLNSVAKKLNSVAKKLKKLEREYSKSERERELYKQRYDSIVNSRVWRYTLPARKLGILTRYVFRPESRRLLTNTDPGEQELQTRGELPSKSEKSATREPSLPTSNSLLPNSLLPTYETTSNSETTSNKGDPLEYVEPNVRSKTLEQVTEKSRDVERYESQIKTKIKSIREKLARSRTLGQATEKSRVESIRKKLYSLGFTERALEDLHKLATNESQPVPQSLAAWELSLWQAEQCSEEGARQCLELLPVALQGEKDPVRLRQAAVMKAECQEVLGNLEAAKLSISHALEELGPHADLFLANANLETSASAKIEWFNKALELHGVSKISFDASTDHPLLDSLRPGQDKHERVEVSGDAKVSVIITVYNAEDTIQTALDSVLSQTWTNLEVLVVDDCSTDSTVAVVEDYARRDSSIRLIRAKTNGGAYVARNLALRVATGAFVTCHDADDWSHPEKIEKQVRHLLCNPLVVGNTSQQARATSDLRFYRKEKPGKYISPNYSSFMFRREPVTAAVGYWDSVRFAADEEFRERVEKVFGDQSVVDEPTGPLSFVRSSSSALTRCEALGFYGAVAGARKEYRESYKHFHDRAKNLFYDFPQNSRPFAVPEPMQPTRESKAAQRRHFDVILVSDFRLPGGTTSSNVEEIKAQKRVGLRTGLIQMSRYGFDPDRPTDPRVRELLDGHQVQMLVYGEKVSCDTLILKHPPILQEWQQFVPDVEAANVHVVMNQTPMNHYGDEGKLEYSIRRCKYHLQKCFGKAGVWHPIGPLVREALYRHHAEELTEITLANEDWTEIIDVDEWRRESRPQRGPRPRIGRHSRDEDRKWPKEPSELLAVYPDSSAYEVHVLGGAEAPKKVLGSLPKNWHVLGFGEVHPKDFLSTLDVFVYYTHPELVEAFGRTILEAMAVGVPVILPYSFRKLFKEAAIYAEPAEVKSRIDRLMIDDDHYESQVGKAWDYVEEHFGYIKYTVRLRKQIGKDIGSVDLTR